MPHANRMFFGCCSLIHWPENKSFQMISRLQRTVEHEKHATLVSSFKLSTPCNSRKELFLRMKVETILALNGTNNSTFISWNTLMHLLCFFFSRSYEKAKWECEDDAEWRTNERKKLPWSINTIVPSPSLALPTTTTKLELKGKKFSVSRRLQIIHMFYVSRLSVFLKENNEWMKKLTQRLNETFMMRL